MQISSLFLSVTNVIISIHFEVSYALLLSKYGFVLFMRIFIFVWDLFMCGTLLVWCWVVIILSGVPPPKYPQSSLFHYPFTFSQFSFIFSCILQSLLSVYKYHWTFPLCQEINTFIDFKFWIFVSVKYAPSTHNCYTHICEMWRLKLKSLSIVTPIESIEFLMGKANSYLLFAPSTVAWCLSGFTIMPFHSYQLLAIPISCVINDGRRLKTTKAFY